MNATQESTDAATTSDAASESFSEAERAAMKERAKELKAESRASKKRADGEGAILEQIAEMPGPDRAMAERLHAIVTGTAPDLWPKTWYGMPAYAKDGKVVCFFQARASSRRGTRRSASTTLRTSTKATCGRPLSRSRS